MVSKSFIAVNYFMNYPEAHNIEARKVAQISYFETDTIHIRNEISFSQISDWLDIEIAVIEKLNPQYRRDYIPEATIQSRVLTLPLGKIGVFILNENLIFSGISRKKYTRSENPPALD